MLGSNNHLKIIDFGTAYFFKSVANDLLEIINKIRNAEKSEQEAYLDYQSKHKATFVGTAEYFYYFFNFLQNSKIDMSLQNYWKMVNVQLQLIFGLWVEFL